MKGPLHGFRDTNQYTDPSHLLVAILTHMALAAAVVELAENSAPRVGTAGERVAGLCDIYRYIHTDIVICLETGCDTA